MRLRLLVLFVLLMGTMFVVSTPMSTQLGAAEIEYVENALTIRVSVASDGTEGNGYSGKPSISADGRFVAFESDASNLVTNDTNNATDVFLHDRETGETTRVSVASDGTEANGKSSQPSISADGRYVAFESDASNLVTNDTNNATDVFLHDRETGETTRVSIASNGTEGNKASWGKTSVSSDGRFVAFTSSATNLVDNDTNHERDIFVHDRQVGETIRVSVASDGTEGHLESINPSISADGRFVVFASRASNLIDDDANSISWDVFVHWTFDIVN